jgi:glycosyltransferase involved in cell wall biosynthesis
MVNRTARSTACTRANRTEHMTASRDPLRVALSMLTLVPGRMDGGAIYARELVRTLGRSATVEATAFVSRAAAGFSADVTERVVNGVTGGASTPRVRTLVEAGLIRRGAIRRAQAGFDVVHAPFTIAVPPAPSGVPLVQTMFDLQHLDLPQFFSRAQLIYRKYFYERTARKAAAVITISEFSKDRIIHHLGVAPEQIFVAHLGVDTSAFTPYLGERENFLLYPATAAEHKNHASLIAGLGILREHDPTLRLVLTGGALGSLGALPDWVDVRGVVPVEELRSLYGSARALVFPSLYEGFGLPLLEAMAAGCPVVSSNAGSLPEICGDAGVLFEPHDPSDLARAVTEAAGRSADLQRLGLERVSQFSWERCAAVHEQAYRFAASCG